MAEIVARCKEANVVVGHPHVEVANAQRIIDEGYRFLMCSAPRSYGTLNNTLKLTGR
jgi:4-hydroxy-2-oxoheptanedioate aldolase